MLYSCTAKRVRWGTHPFTRETKCTMRELFRRQPKFPPFGGQDRQAQVPDDLWQKCPGCKDLIYNRALERNAHVCPRCGHHFRISARQRIALLADEGEIEEWDVHLRTADPLGFSVGSETYQEKARATATKTGLDEAVITGRVEIEGQPFALFITDFSFMGASMGSVYGEKLARAAEQAIAGNLPLLTISSSGGARMQEGMLSLMQMAKTTSALAKLARKRLPHISLMVDPCYGGVPASYAGVGDMIIAEPGARIGLTGPRVIEQVTRQKLPEGFQTAEFSLEHGLIDLVIPRSELRSQLAKIAALYQQARTRKAHGPSVSSLNGAVDE